MPIQDLELQFSTYSTMLPQQIVQDKFRLALRREIAFIKKTFDGDFKDVKILVDPWRSTKFPWHKFIDPYYLIQKTFYKRGQPPVGIEKTKAWIANLVIAKEVLIALFNYLISRIPAIEYALERFTKGYGKDLYLIMNSYIGCCENISNVVREYSTYFNQIQSDFMGATGPTQLKFSSRENIQMGIDQCLMDTKYGKDVIYPSVRTFAEFPILEDVSIIIRHMINRKRSTNKIKEIRFKQDYRTDDMFKVLGKVCAADSRQIEILRRIYDWGSGSVHIGQNIPLSLMWYSFRWLKENRIFDDLKKDCKITEYSVNYVNSIYDQFVLP
jgi:hypothetical protein